MTAATTGDPVRELGRRLDTARRRRGLTFRELEERSGLPRSTLHYLVSGKKRVPDYYLLTALVGALGETWDAGWERLWRAAADGVTPSPRQLPPGLGVLSGRSAALDRLDLLLDEEPAAPRTATVVGPGGVGKTALAVHWAHRRQDHFPDGQLYADLRGFGPADPPLPPEAVLHDLLRALGVAGADVPAGVDARSALFRSLAAGRRLLLVLDNARDSAQVLPLLPGSTTCRTVVTSRAETPTLSLRGAVRLPLDTLPDAPARELLAAHVGADRLDREPVAVADVVRHCAGLPLALSLVATRLAARPSLLLATVAAELADGAGRLDALDAGELTASLRAVFSWSHRALDPSAARLFGLLGLVGGTDVPAGAAAALLGGDAAVPLRRLEAASLLTSPVPGRHRIHDLIGLFAAELPVDEPDAAIERLLDWHLRWADAADRTLLPHRKHVLASPAESFPDYDAALAWCDAEHVNAVAAMRLARTDEHRRLAWQLPHALFGFYQLRREWTEWADAQELALSCVRAVGDRAGEAWVLNGLGIAHVCAGRLDEAAGCFERAIAVRRSLGDLAGEGQVLNNLGEAYRRSGRHDQAYACFSRDLEICRELGDAYGEAVTLNNLGGALSGLGRSGDALATQQESLRLARSVGDRAFESEVLHDLGDLHREAGRLDSARGDYRLAADTAAAAGNLRRHAESLVSLAELTRLPPVLAEATAALVPLDDAGELESRLAAL